jgi:hypothetical protein
MLDRSSWLSESLLYPRGHSDRPVTMDVFRELAIFHRLAPDLFRELVAFHLFELAGVPRDRGTASLRHRSASPGPQSL